MILHILKKDMRILWPYALGVALTDLAAAILQAMIEAFQLRADAEILTAFLWALNIIALVFDFALIAMVVQLDPLPGTRQDWLARPIRRRDMMLAKLLFVMFFVQAPLLAADTLHGLAVGFPFGQSLAAASARNLYLFGLWTLPVLAIAAVTGNIKQTLGLGLAASVGGLAVAHTILELYALFNVTPDTGHTMTSFVLQMGVLLAGAAAVIGLQYFRRATGHARLVLSLAAILAMAAYFLLPQDMAYAIEGRFSPSPGHDLSLAFAPSAAKFSVADSATLAAGSENLIERSAVVALPLAVAGLPSRLTLVGGHVQATLTAPDGNSIKLEVDDFALQMRHRPETVYYQMLRVPGGFFDAHRGQSMRVTLDYDLAIHRPQGTYEMAAEGGTLVIPRVGRCATSVNPSGTSVLLRCMQAGQEQMRVSAALTDPGKGFSNPTRTLYRPSDAPYRTGNAMITRFGSALPFRIAEVAAGFPVGAAQIPEAKVRLSASEPLTWIVRHITITGVRLDAWTVQN